LLRRVPVIVVVVGRVGSVVVFATPVPFSCSDS
jgi:hypothetical protein